MSATKGKRQWWLPVVVIVTTGVVASVVGGDQMVGAAFTLGCILLLTITGCLFFFTNVARWRSYTATYLAGIVLLLLCAVTQFPFRAAFLVSKPALQRLALQVDRGNAPALPARTGLFKIRKAGRAADGSIYLWTRPHPSGSDGFVFRYRGGGYNLWSVFRFNDDWYYICED